MLGASWKVKLFALSVMTLGFAGPVLNHYFHLNGLNWIVFCSSAQGILTGGGLLYAKQVDVHGGTTDTGTRPAPAVTAAAEAKVQSAVQPAPPEPPIARWP